MDNSKKFSIEYLIELLQKVSNIEKCNSEIHNHTYNVDHRTAFRFALCTQSTYLNDEYAGLYVKKRFSTLNMRDYHIYDGIFEFKNNILTNIISHDIFAKIPDLFNGIKKIIFIEGKFDIEVISSFYNKLKKHGKDTSTYIISFVNPNGSDWEQYYEFYLSEFFIKKRKITDIQVPWPKGGTPDLCFLNHSLVEVFGGFLISELSTIRYNNLKINENKKLTKKFYSNIGIVEVKSSQKTSQAKKYLKKSITSSIYEFFPDGFRRNKPLGLLYLNDYRLFIKPPFNNTNLNNTDQLWFNSYCKLLLLSNFKLNELKKILKKDSISREDLKNFIMNNSINSILEEIYFGL